MRGHSVTHTCRAFLCGRLDYAGPDQQVPGQDMGAGLWGSVEDHQASLQLRSQHPEHRPRGGSW